MGIVFVMVIRTPEERTNNSRGLDAAKGQLEGANHGLVGVFGEGDDLGHKGVFILGIALHSAGGFK